MTDLVWETIACLDRLTDVGVIGSCVARDFMMSAFPTSVRPRYIWRVNTTSLVSKAITEITFNDIKFEDNEDKTFYTDLNKTFMLDRFRANKIILIDFLRDTYEIGRLKDGRKITIGREIDKYGIRPRLEIEKTFSPYKPDYPDLWFQSFRAFTESMSEYKGTFIIVSTRNKNGRRVGGKLEVPDTFDAFDLAYKNRLFSYMEAIAGLMLPNSVTAPYLVEFAELDPDHEFGLGPVHYARRYYDNLVATLRIQPNRLFTNVGLSANDRLAAVEHLRARWRKEAEGGYWDA